MQIKCNVNNFARVCHSLAACQRHTPSSLAAVIGISDNEVISLRSLRCVRSVGWKRCLYLTYGALQMLFSYFLSCLTIIAIITIVRCRLVKQLQTWAI